MQVTSGLPLSQRMALCPTENGFYTGKWESTPNTPRPYLHYVNDNPEAQKERAFRSSPEGSDPNAMLPWNYYEW